MSASEIATASQQYRKRVEAILTTDELARFDAYHQRIESAIAHGETAAVALTAEEQAALDRIEADTEAAALRKQLDSLLRITKQPQ
jgi:hypothetical protein